MIGGAGARGCEADNYLRGMSACEAPLAPSPPGSVAHCPCIFSNVVDRQTDKLITHACVHACRAIKSCVE